MFALNAAESNAATRAVCMQETCDRCSRLRLCFCSIFFLMPIITGLSLYFSPCNQPDHSEGWCVRRIEILLALPVLVLSRFDCQMWRNIWGVVFAITAVVVLLLWLCVCVCFAYRYGGCWPSHDFAASRSSDSDLVITVVVQPKDAMPATSTELTVSACAVLHRSQSAAACVCSLRCKRWSSRARTRIAPLLLLRKGSADHRRRCLNAENNS